MGCWTRLPRPEPGASCFRRWHRAGLTDRYLKGIPADSRAATGPGFLRPEHITDAVLAGTARLNALALERGQTLAQMALTWVLRHRGVTSALIGASRVSQIDDAVGALAGAELSAAELELIEGILREHPGS